MSEAREHFLKQVLQKEEQRKSLGHRGTGLQGVGSRGTREGKLRERRSHLRRLPAGPQGLSPVLPSNHETP